MASYKVDIIFNHNLPILPLAGADNKIEVVEYRDHGGEAEKYKDGSEDPQQERQCGVEETVSNGVEEISLLEEVGDIPRGHQRGLVPGTVDQNVDLVDEPD